MNRRFQVSGVRYQQVSGFRFQAVALIGMLCLASAAYAQDAPAPEPTSGPLVLERIQDGWVIAPDFKLTDVDGRTGELAGAYGGRLLDNTLLIGGAFYHLTNDDRDFKLTYGGLAVGWQSREFGRIRFGGRGLVGGGTATLGFNLDGRPIAAPATRQGGRNDIRFGVPTGPRAQIFPAPRFIARDDFLAVEPQANVSARITKVIGVSCGVGYRETAGADILGDRLNGATANLAVQFGW